MRMVRLMAFGKVHKALRGNPNYVEPEHSLVHNQRNAMRISLLSAGALLLQACHVPAKAVFAHFMVLFPTPDRFSNAEMIHVGGKLDSDVGVVRLEEQHPVGDRRPH